MTEPNIAAAAADEEPLAGSDAVDAVDEQLIKQLADRARAEGCS